MSSIEEASKAMEQLSGSVFKGRNLIVKEATISQEKTERKKFY